MTEKEDKSGLPLKQEVFLEAGVHIGTKIRTNDMRQYVFKRRDDGLFILDIRKSAERLVRAAKLLAKYKPEDVLIVASRVYSSNPATRFSKLTGVGLVKGRFVPGTLTNIESKGFKEPKIIFVCDPKGERSAILEAAKNGVPVIALCDTDNETKFIDLIIPINNKGRRSLALIFYLLARELMVSSGKISSYDEFRYEPGYFEKMVTEEEEKEEQRKAEEAEKKAEEEKTEEKEGQEPPEKKAKPKQPEKKEKKEEKKAEKAKEEKKPTEEKAKKETKKSEKKAEKKAPKKEESKKKD